MSQAVRDLPHGTTIVAATCDHGVVLAGDRRATMGNLIAKRDLEKVFRSEEVSAYAYAGTACVPAAYDAADDASATGGPDLARHSFPVVATITADGFRKLSEAEAEDVAGHVVRERLARPDGPRAPLR